MLPTLFSFALGLKHKNIFRISSDPKTYYLFLLGAFLAGIRYAFFFFYCVNILPLFCDVFNPLTLTEMIWIECSAIISNLYLYFCAFLLTVLVFLPDFSFVSCVSFWSIPFYRLMCLSNSSSSSSASEVSLSFSPFSVSSLLLNSSPPIFV